jgi:hypothetical protein
MDYNKYARIAGASFIISYLGLIAGSLVAGTILEGDYLALAGPNAIQLGLGMLLESLNGIAVICIAAMMYLILKHYNEGIALTYLIFRIVEAFLSVLGSTKALALIELSNAYLDAGSVGEYFTTIGQIILADRHWHMEMLTVFFILGGLLFYYLLYRSEVVPRYISLWGLIAIVLMSVFNVLLYLSIDLGLAVSLVFALPIIANEIFIAFWLMIKGVDTSSIIQA